MECTASSERRGSCSWRARPGLSGGRGGQERRAGVWGCQQGVREHVGHQEMEAASMGSSSGNVSAKGREPISYRKDTVRACWLSSRLEHTHRLYRRKQ